MLAECLNGLIRQLREGESNFHKLSGSAYFNFNLTNTPNMSSPSKTPQVFPKKQNVSDCREERWRRRFLLFLVVVKGGGVETAIVEAEIVAAVKEEGEEFCGGGG